MTQSQLPTDRPMMFCLNAALQIEFCSPSAGHFFDIDRHRLPHITELFQIEEQDEVRRSLLLMQKHPEAEAQKYWISREEEELRCLCFWQAEGPMPRLEGQYQIVMEPVKQAGWGRATVDNYRSIIENINLGILEVDCEDRILWANEPFCQNVGYSLSELDGQVAHELLFFKKDQGSLDTFSEIRQQREQGESGSYELRIRHKEGQVRWMIVSGTPIYNANGEVVGSTGLHHDITSYKEVEEQLRHRSELQQVLMNLAERLININPSEVKEVINESLQKMGQFVASDRAYIFDYDFEQGTTSNTYEWCAEGISPEIDNLQDVPIEYIPQWVNTHREGRELINEDVFSLPEDDALYQILVPQGIRSIITIPLIHESELLGFIGFDAVHQRKKWSDTEREILRFMAQLLVNQQVKQRIETSIFESEERLRSIFDNAMDAMVLTDSEGRVEAWNKQAERLFGKSRIEVLDQSLGTLIFPEGQEDIGEQAFYGAADRPVQKRFERMALGKNNQYFPIEISVNRIPLLNRDLYSVFLRDITERKKVEDDMAQSLEQQKQISRMRARLVSMASHEFRTPLTTLKNNTELLIMQVEELDEALQPKLTKYIQRLEIQINRLNELIGDMLTLGRLDSGRLQFKPRNTDLIQLCDQLLKSHHSHYPDRERAELRINGLPRIVKLDQNLWEHIFNNLVSNAFKYSPGAPSPVVELDYEDSRHVKISIIDYGLGIAEEEQEAIFDSFYRVRGNAAIQGSGMGLAIVQQMTQLHGIKIKVESSPGQGSSFILVLE